MPLSAVHPSHTALAKLRNPLPKHKRLARAASLGSRRFEVLQFGRRPLLPAAAGAAGVL